MIRPLRVPIALAAAAIVAGACARDGACAAAWCGTAVIASPAESRGLFPPLRNNSVDAALADLLFVKLADLGPDLNTVGDEGFSPRLAQTWTRDDTLTLTFGLNPSARWHDGAPVTADDVVFSFDVYRDTLVGAVPGPRLAGVRDVTAPDRHTVTIRFARAYAEQLYDAVYHVHVLPRHLLDSVPRARLATHAFGRAPVGGGPYRFVRWRAGEYLELAGDSTHFLGRPGIPRVIWRFTPDPQTALTQVLAGDADVIDYAGGPEQIRRVESSATVLPLHYSSLVYTYIAFNLRDPEQPDAPHPLFADRSLRRALTVAVDRATVVGAVMQDFGEVAIGPLTRDLAIWHDSLAALALPHDADAAADTLAALGWQDDDGDGVRERDGVPLVFDLLVPNSSAARVRAAQIVAEQLRRVGVDMRIEALEFQTTFARAEDGRFDAIFGAFGGDPSPASIAEVWTSDGIGAFNYGRYVNPRVDGLVADALGTRDRDVARGRWHAALATLIADAPAIFVYVPMAVAAVHARFENVSLRPDQWAATLPTWRVAPGRLIARDRLGVQ